MNTILAMWIGVSILVFVIWVMYTIEDRETSHDEGLANALACVRSRDETIVRLERERKEKMMADDLIYNRIDRLDVQIQGLRTALASSRERERDLKAVIASRNQTIVDLQADIARLQWLPDDGDDWIDHERKARED